jgi:divalent metal cation (Fe/Co/Zn/Cd) transporter
MICAFAGLAGAFKEAWFLDPIGGIVVGLIILRSWVKTGREQISCLIGRAAPPEFVSKVTYVAATNSPQILRVDTVRAYHFGVRFVVEVDVVLPEDMPLKQAHDIGEALEERIEMLDDVERAYVHLDYEFDHKPERLPGQGNRHD